LPFVRFTAGNGAQDLRNSADKLQSTHSREEKP
jgi:hypothetical protein